MDLKYVGLGVMGWIYLAASTNKWRDFVNKVIHVYVPLHVGNFLTGWVTSSFSKRLYFMELNKLLVYKFLLILP